MNDYIKKEVYINEDYVADSTVDIWSTEHLGNIQYILHKCSILKFILESNDGNKYHYVMNDLSFYLNHLEVTDENIEECFNNGDQMDMYTSSSAVKYAVYRRGKWYLSLPKDKE